MTSTSYITLGELAKRIADGTVDIQSIERPRSDADLRREVAKSYTADKSLAALFELASDGRIKPRSAADTEVVEFLLSRNSLLTSEDTEIAVRCLRAAVDWAAFWIEQEKRKRQAGRNTIEEAAKELAANTGLNVDRWQKTLLAEVKQGRLPLKNPRDVDDRLPYAVPDDVDFVLALEQVTSNDLNILLENNPGWGVAYRFQTASAQAQAATDTRVSVSLQQENAVTNKIRDMGINPLAFPKNAPGIAGRKSEVRDAVLGTHPHLFMSVKVFEHTWTRLRTTRQIVDA